MQQSHGLFATAELLVRLCRLVSQAGVGQKRLTEMFGSNVVCRQETRRSQYNTK